MAFEKLFDPGDQLTLALATSILEQNGIAHRVIERGISPVAFAMPSGTDFDLATHEIQVPEECLGEAKRILCEHDIICDISEELRARCFQTIVLPLLADPQADLRRLINYLRVNNKATVAAILQDTLDVRGGDALLQRLFFALLPAEELLTLNRLARFLQDHPIDDLSDAIRGRRSELTDLERRNLADVLGLLPSIHPEATLVELLADPDQSVRDRAIESLFTLTRKDFGFEPDAEPGRREACIEHWKRYISRRETS